MQTGHLAPEQVDPESQPLTRVSGLNAEVAIDIYGCGVLLHRLLTGRVSIYPEPLVPFMDALLDPAPPELAALRDCAPLAVEAVAQRCLAFDPAERYADMAVLREALQSIPTVDRPLNIHPLPTPAPLAKAPAAPPARRPRPTTKVKLLLDPLPSGEAGYLAAEQLDDLSGDTASADVYALGCLVHTLLAGRPLFNAKSAPALFREISRGRPRVDPLLRQRGGPELERVVTAAVATQPRDRPPLRALREAVARL